MRNRGPDLSLRVADTVVSRTMVIAGILALCFFAGLSLQWIPTEVVLGLAIIGAAAWFCIRRPYAGLILYLCLEFLRPTERFPVLSPLHLTRFVAVFVLIGWLVRRRKDGFELRVKAPENIAVLLFVFAAAASVPFAVWKAPAFDTALDVARMAIVFVLIANIINTPKRLMGFMTAYILLNVVVSGEQLFHYNTISAGPEGLLRVGGASGSFLGEDGDFALAMGVALPFVYYLAWSNIKPVFRGLSAAAALMFVGSVIATGSRGGAVGLAAVLVTLVLRSRKRLLAVSIVVGVILLAVALAPGPYVQRMATIAAPHEQDLTAQSRMLSWEAARKMFIDHPFVGVGAGNFLTAFVSHYGGSYSWSKTAHNVFYQAAAELGLCGLVSFVMLLGCALGRSVILNARLVRAGLGSAPMTAFAAALFPSAVGFLTAGSFQTPLYYPHIFIIAALAVALNNIAKSTIPEETSEARSKWTSQKRTWRRFAPTSK